MQELFVAQYKKSVSHFENYKVSLNFCTMNNCVNYKKKLRTKSISMLIKTYGTTR